jgi:hypothetical protein
MAGLKKTTVSFDASRNTRPLYDYDGTTDETELQKEQSDLELLTQEEEDIFKEKLQKPARILPPENPIIEPQEWVPRNEIEKRFNCPMENIVATKTEFKEWQDRGWC